MRQAVTGHPRRLHTRTTPALLTSGLHEVLVRAEISLSDSVPDPH